MIKPFWGIAAVAFLGTTVVVGAVVVTASGGTEEAVQVQQSASPSTLPTLTPQPPSQRVPSPGPATPTRSASSPTPTPASGEQAPGGCIGGEQVYQDPAGRFDFCYPSDMQLGTSETQEGKIGVRVGYGVGEPNNVEVNVGWDRYPAYVPCQEATGGFEVRNQRFQDLIVDGRSVAACLEDLYQACIPGPTYPDCSPGAFYLTTVDFAVPATTGRPILFLVGYAGESATRNDVSLPAIWRRIVDSSKIY